jgi:hypothetical protein
MSPDAFANFKLNTSVGNADFTAALMASLGEANATGEASLGEAIATDSWPSDVYVYPLNAAMAAQAVYESKHVAGKALAKLTNHGISFKYNGVLVRCNATLAVPPTLRSSGGAKNNIIPVAVAQATINANMMTLGMVGYEGYGDVMQALRVVAHSLLGQAGKTLSDVVLRPSPETASKSDLLFTFTDETVGETFEELLAEKEVKILWRNVTYVLQPQSGLHYTADDVMMGTSPRLAGRRPQVLHRTLGVQPSRKRPHPTFTTPANTKLDSK